MLRPERDVQLANEVQARRRAVHTSGVMIHNDVSSRIIRHPTKFLRHVRQEPLLFARLDQALEKRGYDDDDSSTDVIARLF